MPTLSLTRRRSLVWLATLAMLRPAMATPLPLLLAKEAPRGVDPAGFLVSEKYDGVRAFWVGHGLRFRSGRPMAAPRWFLQRLPAMPLDGELWLGRGRFDALSGLVRSASVLDSAWREVRYMLFELPGASSPFAARAARLQAIARDVAWPQLVAVDQIELADPRALQMHLDDAVVGGGGEGLMLHRANAAYQAGRADVLLKLKPLQDAEALVVGVSAGRGRHAGWMGALHVRTPDGVPFDLGTGFSDAQREHPPATGTWVTYSHRGLTSSGVPRLASFMRVAGP